MLEIKVTLRVYSQKISLKNITDQLQCEPEYGFSRGDLYARDRRTRDHSLWTIESKLSPKDDFEQHILTVLDFMDNKQDAIVQLKKDCTIDLFCYLGTENGQGGAVLSSQVMKKVIQHDLNIMLDVHATDDSE